MKKIILTILLVFLSFTTGVIFTFYNYVGKTAFSRFLESLLPLLPLPHIEEKFNGTLYYATDRTMIQTNTGIDYLEKPSENISYGVLTTKVLQERYIGTSIPFDSNWKITPLSRDSLIKKLQYDNKKPLIIWVHGHKNSFQTNFADFAQLAYDININATFLTFDWASKNLPEAYKENTQQILISSKHFADLLDDLVKTVKPPRMIIIAHSLGCRLVALTLKELYDKRNWSDADKELSDVIFIAPDIDRKDYSERLNLSLISMVNKLSVYVSSKDNALLLSKLLYGTRSIGLPIKSSSNTELDEIQAFLYYQKTRPHTIDIIDVSYLPIKDFLRHIYFQERPVLEDLHDLIDENIPAEHRYLLKYKNGDTKDRVNYWFISP